MLLANIKLSVYSSSCVAYFPSSDYEELVMNSLTTFNNLSYYAQAESYVVKRQEEITECKPSYVAQM